MTMMPPSQTFRRGDVVLVLFPHSNLRTAKPRPALVVQADDLQTGLPQLIVAMISSRLFRAQHPSRVLILRSSQAGQASGLLSAVCERAERLTIGNNESGDPCPLPISPESE
jgi:mRNA interferase MazF